MSVSTEPKKRRAWLAALLSLLLPGLGQLYNRQVRLALALIILFFLLSIPTRWLIAAVPADVVVPVNAVVWFVAIASFLFAIVQAASNARRANAVFLAWYNRWYVYIGVIVVMTVCDSVLELVPVPSIDAYNSPSGSMSPTLVEGDYFQTRTMAFARPPAGARRDRCLQADERSGGGLHQAHRRAAGDRIQMRDGRLYINDVMVERVELESRQGPHCRLSTIQVTDYTERRCPAGSVIRFPKWMTQGRLTTRRNRRAAQHVFVLGDNRDRFERQPGKLACTSPLSGLHDKPLFIYWSADKSRIGKVLE